MRQYPTRPLISDMNIPTTSIIMVGPRGVGKTSLLAAMYKELESELDALGCRLNIEGPTQKAINDQLKDLKALAKEPSVRVQTGEGISGTSDQRDYTFEMKVADGLSMPLRFTDLPGGWYTADGDYKKADELLGASHVSLLAVDATALMTDGGKYHDEINRPDDILESYKRAPFPKDHTHTVILTLIRAETYVKDGKIVQLQNRAREAYKELAGRLGKQNIPLIGCHVETVGSLFFNCFKKTTNGTLESHFARDPKIGYRPSRCALPLRIAASKAIGNALDEALKEVIKNDNFWNRIVAMFGFETALEKAKEKYAALYEPFEKIEPKIREDEDAIFEIKP